MNVTDPDGMDWYFNEDEQKFEWRNSTERTLVIDGKMYRNVGQSHAEKAGDRFFGCSGRSGGESGTKAKLDVVRWNIFV